MSKIDLTNLNKVDTELVLPSTSENTNLQRLQENKWGSILNNQTFNTLNNNVKLLKNSLVETINTLNNENIIAKNKYINDDNNVVSLGDSTKKLNFLTTQIQVNGVDTEFLTSQNLSNISNIAYKDRENTFTFPLNTNQYNINSNQVINDDNGNINIGNSQRKLNLQSSDGKLYLNGQEFKGGNSNDGGNNLIGASSNIDIMGKFGDIKIYIPRTLMPNFYENNSYEIVTIPNTDLITYLKGNNKSEIIKKVIKYSNINAYMIPIKYNGYDKDGILKYQSLLNKLFNIIDKFRKKESFLGSKYIVRFIWDLDFKIDMILESGEEKSIKYNESNLENGGYYSYDGLDYRSDFKNIFDMFERCSVRYIKIDKNNSNEDGTFSLGFKIKTGENNFFYMTYFYLYNIIPKNLNIKSFKNIYIEYKFKGFDVINNSSSVEDIENEMDKVINNLESMYNLNV